MRTLLQINVTNNVLSTGKIASEIGEIALDRGFESYIAYARGFKPSRNIPIKVSGKWSVYLHALSARFFDNCGFSLFSYFATKKLICKISRIKPDIIHLHILHGYYLYIPTLFNYLKESGIPVIWTIHSCWDFTGHCGFYTMVACDKWKTGCFNCPQLRSYPKSVLLDSTKRNWNKKKRLFTSISNFSLIPVSHWLEGQLRDPFLNNHPIKVIYNGIDTSIFKPVDYNAKEKRGWNNKKVLIGVASTWDKRKGLTDYIELAKILSEDFLIVLVGLKPFQCKNLPVNILPIERTYDVNELVELYNAADIVLNLSYEETFGLTTVEGMACGTPGIVYNSTASPELISDTTGRIVAEGDIEGVKNAIEVLLQNIKEYYIGVCRDRVLEKFDKGKQDSKNVDSYEQIVANQVNKRGRVNKIFFFITYRIYGRAAA